MYSYDYIFEKFTQALCDLATGKGDARSRIGEAYYKFWHIKLEEFPVEIRHKRLEIDRLLTKLPGRTGYLIPDNLARMKNKTAAKIASLILDIYFELEEFRKSTKFKNSYIFLSKTDDKCEINKNKDNQIIINFGSSVTSLIKEKFNLSTNEIKKDGYFKKTIATSVKVNDLNFDVCFTINEVVKNRYVDVTINHKSKVQKITK